MQKVYVVAAKRSAVGSFNGTLTNDSILNTGSKVLSATLDEYKIPRKKIDEVIIGNVLSANLGQGPARQVSMNANIPKEIPAYSLNMVCGSGLKSVMNAYLSIGSGNANLIVAGGIESMSDAPYLIPGARRGLRMGEKTIVDHMIKDSLWESFNDYHMGNTAENIAKKYKITREEQDEFAYNSQLKARKATESGRFKEEIVPLTFSIRKKGNVVFDKDEHIHYTTDLEKLANLRPAFKKNGTVTAGNASGINDGVSFVVLASEEFAKKNNLEILAEVIGIGQGGVNPNVMGMGPVPAIKNALKNAKLKLENIDLLELNEAFAAQSLGVVTELVKQHKVTKEWILERTNVNGGAIALGHPVGASGNRILVTLVHEMLKRDDANLGLASLCIGGGMGTAVIVKKVNN